MKKIPTLFKRVFTPDHKKTITREVTPGCECVLRGECIATVKWDGACCAIINGEIYKRYDAKIGKGGKQKQPPEGAIPCQPEPDPITGHWPHWVKCDPANPADKYFLRAFEHYKKRRVILTLKYDYIPFKQEFFKSNKPITFEAIGPHFQGNPYNLEDDDLARHGDPSFYPELLEDYNGNVTFDSIRNLLEKQQIEGIVFWLDGQPLCKIKRSDFGFPCPPKKGAK